MKRPARNLPLWLAEDERRRVWAPADEVEEAGEFEFVQAEALDAEGRSIKNADGLPISVLPGFLELEDRGFVRKESRCHYVVSQKGRDVLRRKEKP